MVTIEILSSSIFLKNISKELKNDQLIKKYTKHTSIIIQTKENKDMTTKNKKNCFCTEFCTMKENHKKEDKYNTKQQECLFLQQEIEFMQELLGLKGFFISLLHLFLIT